MSFHLSTKSIEWFAFGKPQGDSKPPLIFMRIVNAMTRNQMASQSCGIMMTTILGHYEMNNTIYEDTVPLSSCVLYRLNELLCFCEIKDKTHTQNFRSGVLNDGCL